MESILNLPEAYAQLSPEQKRRFDALFTFSRSEGKLKVPDTMKPWAQKQFGSWEKLESQQILMVTNHVSLEGALFNKLRADRPMQKGVPVNKEELLATAAKEPFVDVETGTPKDLFGRVKGRFEHTASNVAKCDANHGVIVFDNPDPLGFTEEETVSHFNAALAWIGATHLNDPDAKYPVIGWNCLWKAAASLVHGHQQVLLGVHPYAAMLANQRCMAMHTEKTGEEYWPSLFEAHAALGLGDERDGVKAFAHLTPKKEKEIVLLCDVADERLFKAIYRVLAALRDDLGVESFNLAMLLPPLDGSWHATPIVTRIVDRGALGSRTTDLAFIELYLNQSVVSSDPVKVWEAVRKRL